MPSSHEEVLAIAREAMQEAADSIAKNIASEDFLEAVVRAARLMKDSSNRIIVTGMGKSGLIARKTAATLTSTGSPSVYLHPADALHGDMGNIQNHEIVLAYSNSGETREIVELLPHVRLLGAKLIAVTQKSDSTLAREADVAIVYSITREGCPLNLAPMASTTISLVIGDAISAAILHLKKFRTTDFGRFHPSGALGKKLLTKTGDVMQTEVPKYIVEKAATFKEILSAMVTSNMGAVLVIGSKGHLRGILTDGDIKRLIDQYENNFPELFAKTAEELMTPDPVWIDEDSLVEKAASIMQDRNTYSLPVLNSQKKPVGIVRMHDVIGFI